MWINLRILFSDSVWQPFGYVLNHTLDANGNKGGVEFQRCFANFWEIPFYYFDIDQGPWESRNRSLFSSAILLRESRKGQTHQATSKATNSKDTCLAWEQPRRPSAGQWINKMQCVQTMGYHSAARTNELIPPTTWRNFRCTLLNERKSPPKTVCCMITFT